MRPQAEGTGVTHVGVRVSSSYIVHLRQFTYVLFSVVILLGVQY